MVVTMMWDNSPTAGAAATSGASKEAGKAAASMTMSDGKVMSAMSGMSGMSGMSMTTATGTAMAGMNMTGAAGRTELAPGAMGVGWIVISLGAGVGFLAGALGGMTGQKIRVREVGCWGLGHQTCRFIARIEPR